MPFPYNGRMSTTPDASRADLYARAIRHLGRKCPVMKALIRRVGPCTLTPMPDDAFTLLVRTVIAQQISTKAATSISAKLAAALGGAPIARSKLARFRDDQFQACGVSGPKRRTLRAVCSHLEMNPELLPGIELRDDETIRTQLTAIKGIGPWSVDMILMFGFGRPDVLPVGDLGLRMGVRDTYELEAIPGPAQLTEIAAKWQPYRSIATWYLWRSRGPVPQSASAPEK